MLVKAMFFVVTLCYLCLQAAGFAQETVQPVIPTPQEACASYTLPDDLQTCYLGYLSDRSYEQATDPQRVALYTSFPVLFVVVMAYLGLRLVRSS